MQYHSAFRNGTQSLSAGYNSILIGKFQNWTSDADKDDKERLRRIEGDHE